MTYSTWMLLVTAASPAIAMLVAAGALRAWWLKRTEQRNLARQAELRLNDVLAWAMQTVFALQSITVVLRLGREDMSRQKLEDRALDLLFEVTALIEQGRMFFRNEVSPHGSEKHFAYRGLRPRVLDPLVGSYEAVCAWRGGTGEQDAELLRIAVDAEQRFVSLIRDEVGRSRTASLGAARGGKGIDLAELLSCRGKADFDRLYG